MIRVVGDPIERVPLTRAKIREIKIRLEAARRPPLTDQMRKVVTIEAPLPSNVTKRAKPAGSGRRKTYASGAEKQRAYRERQRATA